MGIVSENLARESWGSAQAAIGKRFREYASHAVARGDRRGAGCARERRRRSGAGDRLLAALLHEPLRARSIDATRAVTFAVHSRSRGNREPSSARCSGRCGQVNANLPVASIRTMQDIYSRSMARTSFTLVMLAIAGSMALALGLIGIYGVISYAVSQRTREIGIRLALGAQKGELRWMFVRSALALTGVGVVIGLGAAAAVAQMMRTLLFGVSPLDPLSFAAVPFILAAAAVLASFLPASRVAAINPVDALKKE